jgi:ribosome-binding factor A
MSQRPQRVADLLKREISDIILKQIKDPRVGFVTITRVKVSKDLKFAKVYFSVLSSMGNNEDSLAGLKSAHVFFRSELNNRIRLRYIPQLEFFIDDTLDYVEKIEQLIEKAKE